MGLTKRALITAAPIPSPSSLRAISSAIGTIAPSAKMATRSLSLCCSSSALPMGMAAGTSFTGVPGPTPRG